MDFIGEIHGSKEYPLENADSFRCQNITKYLYSLL